MTALKDHPRTEPEALIEEARRRRRKRIGAFAIVFTAAVAIAVVAFVVLDSGADAPISSQRHAAGALAGGCRSQVRVGVLPVWARAGFSQRRPRMPYTLGANRRIAAIPFVSLDSPSAADHNNKILWVAHVRTPYGPSLKISAQRMSGSKPLGGPVYRTVAEGPGPSIVDLPRPGCWRLTLRWSGQTDQLDLKYNRPS